MFCFCFQSRHVTSCFPWTCCVVCLFLWSQYPAEFANMCAQSIHICVPSMQHSAHPKSEHANCFNKHSDITDCFAMQLDYDYTTLSCWVKMHTFFLCLATYCWWLKSCTTWDVKTLQIVGEATYQLVSRISAINSTTLYPIPCAIFVTPLAHHCGPIQMWWSSPLDELCNLGVVNRCAKKGWNSTYEGWEEITN